VEHVFPRLHEAVIRSYGYPRFLNEGVLNILCRNLAWTWFLALQLFNFIPSFAQGESGPLASSDECRELVSIVVSRGTRVEYSEDYPLLYRLAKRQYEMNFLTERDWFSDQLHEGDFKFELTNSMGFRTSAVQFMTCLVLPRNSAVPSCMIGIVREDDEVLSDYGNVLFSIETIGPPDCMNLIQDPMTF
jgi:hypothetical protein